MPVEVVDSFPHSIREIEYERIPLSDGTYLACRYWLPEGTDDEPVPAILEYIPYCTRDGTAARDEAIHPYFAGHGYAAVRVDMRGSGESEGVLLDEYLKLEQDDAIEVIAWIAEQAWCDGNVGMMGKSWGGFNGLQVAARRPPALKCIITVFSTEDRYNGDLHYTEHGPTTRPGIGRRIVARHVAAAPRSYATLDHSLG
jgi:putative CocE/NonD family hydrolase